MTTTRLTNRTENLAVGIHETTLTDGSIVYAVCVEAWGQRLFFHATDENHALNLFHVISTAHDITD